MRAYVMSSRPDPGSAWRARPSVGEVLASQGEPLDMASQARLAPRLGFDFSQVKIHADSRAGESAVALHARSYTVGQHIVFAEGEYAPETAAGESLLVHELTHVMQQRQAPDGAPRDPETSGHGDDGEREAESAVTAFAAGHRPPTVTSVMPRVQRQQPPTSPEEEYIAKGDWHGAAWALSQMPTAELRERLERMTESRLQFVVEGAFHGAEWRERVIAVAGAVSHRDKAIGGVRYFVWKRMWAEAGTYLCGLDNKDIRRIVRQLGLNRSDLLAMLRAQPDDAQVVRLNTAIFEEDRKFAEGLPPDLVDPAKAPDLVVSWLLMHPLVKPFAEKRWPGAAARPHVTMVAASEWKATYVEHETGTVDSQSGAKVSAEQAAAEASSARAFTTEAGEIFVNKTEAAPSVLIHEALHALASSAMDGEFGRLAEEGTAEYFARQVAEAAKRDPGTAYPREVAGIAALAAVVGDEVLANAYFGGETLPLTERLEAIKGHEKRRSWEAAMRDKTSLKDAPAMLK